MIYGVGVKRMPDRKFAAAYIRVSTEDQAEYSPDSQLAHIKDYAKHNGMILLPEHIYVDEGISGRNTRKREAFNRMIGVAKSKEKPFDIILVWKFSRFARNREDSIVYKSMLRKQCGIDVVSISESLGDDKTSILIEALIEAMDEYYSINLAEEVKRGMTEKASRGEIVSVAPFGYRIENGTFVPDDNAQFVVGIFKDFLAGMGYRQLATKYTALGARTRFGNVLDNRFIEYLLNNPAYVGKIRWSTDGQGASKRKYHNPNTILADGNHEPLIDSAVFEATQKRIADLKTRYGKYQRIEQPAEYMLKGLVRCHNCGSTLTYQKANRGLQCHSYSRGTCNISHFIAMDKIESAVIEYLQSVIESKTFQISVSGQPVQTKNDITPLIRREEQKLKRAKLAYTEGIDTLEEYRETKAAIETRIAALKAQEEKKPAPINEAAYRGKIQDVIEVLRDPSQNPQIKNAALRSIISKIVLYKPENRIEVYFHV